MMARTTKKTPSKKRATKRATKKPAKKPAPPPKVVARLTVIIEADIVERARNIAYWTPGVTLAGLVETGLTQMVKKLERERGESFPQRGGKLQAGRPFKT